MTAAPPAPGRDRPGEKLNFRRRLADYYRRLMESPGKIDEVAGGFALGIFIACSPWLGLHTLLVLALCTLTRRSLAAGIMGSLVFNPLTGVFIFAAELELGRHLLHRRHLSLPRGLTLDYEGLKLLLHASGHLFLPLLIGSLIIGGAAAVIAFFWLRTSLRAYRRRVYLRRKSGPDA
jgi:hypothetical protein